MEYYLSYYLYCKINLLIVYIISHYYVDPLRFHNNDPEIVLFSEI